MGKPTIVSILATAICALLTSTSNAHETNAWPVQPTTKLEALEIKTGTIIVKGITQMGGVSASAGVLSVSCKEVTDASTGQKESGIAIVFTVGGQQREMLQVDYDELESLVKSLDYLCKVNGSVTTLNSFEAAYTTKGGLRLAAFTSKRTGGVGYAVRNTHATMTPVPLTEPQFAMLRSLVEQAKGKLDGMRQGTAR